MDNYTAEYTINQVRADYTQRVKSAKDARALWIFMRENLNLFPDLTSYKEKNIAYWVNCFIGSIDLTIKVPWDTVLTDQVINEFTKLGWNVYDTQDYIKNYKEITYRLKHPVFESKNIRVIVDMNAEKEGSKCKLIVDHVEKRDVNIYRVECEDMVNV